MGYTQGDARRLPFPRASFDVAFLVAVLGEVPEPRKCLRALHRVLRPGGLLSITEHLPDPDFSKLSTLRALVEGEGFDARGALRPALELHRELPSPWGGSS